MSVWKLRDGLSRRNGVKPYRGWREGAWRHQFCVPGFIAKDALGRGLSLWGVHPIYRLKQRSDAGFGLAARRWEFKSPAASRWIRSATMKRKLKQEARNNAKGLKNEIASTPQLVVKSASSSAWGRPQIRQFMKHKFSRHYQASLRTHLKQGSRAGLQLARGLGQQALAAGLRTLDLAKLHEQTLVDKVLPGCRAGKRVALIKQAGIFFTEAITPIEKNHRGPREAAVHLNQIVEMLSQRTVELAASNLELKAEIAHRKAMEEQLLHDKESVEEQLLRIKEAVQKHTQFLETLFTSMPNPTFHDSFSVWNKQFVHHLKNGPVHNLQ